MKEALKKDLKKYLYTLLVFVVLILILASMHFFLATSFNDGLKHAVQKTLNTLPDTSLILGVDIQLNTTGITPISAWTVTDKKYPGQIIVALPITGDSGPHTAIFHWTPGNKARFLSLVGIPESNLEPGRFGFTDRLIQYRIIKINRMISSRENIK